jgi:Flp pilus assembly pilin Flp
MPCYDPAMTDRRELTQPDHPSGQALVEYVLIVSLIAITALVALSFFGTQMSDILSTISEMINR